MTEEGQGEGGVRRIARPYSAVVGVLFLAAIVFAGINAVSNKAPSLQPGDHLPKFAAPSATGVANKDANINPDRACTITVKDAIRVCDYFDAPLVMIAWFKRGCDACRPQLDTVERVRTRFPRVHFLGLDIKDSLENAAKEVRKHDWGFPMALDRNGDVSRLYAIVGGPTLFFAYPGGVLQLIVRGELDERALVAHVETLVRASRARGASGRGGYQSSS
jgi:peroxiredoxin